ncbi:unnamed protein product [Pleuronectes platessa]|uniref:Uncharacterized protein n=1 Tax=Pleuronectes platessa TaxID=8262 RepID=A0A9N7Y1A7_PLEPL|nr:unnamed protein product [Pleuronectes platessa]
MWTLNTRYINVRRVTIAEVTSTGIVMRTCSVSLLQENDHRVKECAEPQQALILSCMYSLFIMGWNM